MTIFLVLLKSESKLLLPLLEGTQNDPILDEPFDSLVESVGCSEGGIERLDNVLPFETRGVKRL